MGKPRLTVRNKFYRGSWGYTVSGHDTGGRRVKLFAKKRPVAERLREMVRVGLTITASDFIPHPDEEG